jgi:hypothetical protein
MRPLCLLHTCLHKVYTYIPKQYVHTYIGACIHILTHTYTPNILCYYQGAGYDIIMQCDAQALYLWRMWVEVHQERFVSTPVPRNTDRGHPPRQKTNYTFRQKQFECRVHTEPRPSQVSSRCLASSIKLNSGSGMKVIYLTKNTWNCYPDRDAGL